VDSRVVNKHRNDVIRLSGQLTGKAATIPENIRADMESFLTKLSDENIDLRSLNQRGSVEDVIKRIREGFGL
jgi:hypothetical protein